MFPSNTRILVVDDFQSIREIMCQSLKKIGFTNVLQAEDGLVAWKALVNVTPSVQLVICDWNMPNLNGLELLKKIRETERFKKIPFLLVTTENEKEKIMDAIKAGVSNYVVKPFTDESLQKKLEDTYAKLKG